MMLSGVFGTGLDRPVYSPGGAGWIVRFSAGGASLTAVLPYVCHPTKSGNRAKTRYLAPCMAPTFSPDRKRKIGPKNASFEAPLSVANITIPVTTSIRYRKIRLAGSGAEWGRFGTMNLRNK